LPSFLPSFGLSEENKQTKKRKDHTCECPLEVPKCAPGVGLALDGCKCCKVCAKQLNEDCSKTQPCDHTKGLECNFGASSTALKGICRGKSAGRPCEYNSKIYQNGESFQPNCKHQCTCIDGAVGCIPLCSQELSLPNLGMLSPKYEKLTSFLPSNPKCLVQTTSWSQCSKTCGTGVSTRVTNDNPGCRLVKETRICEVRPCGQSKFWLTTQFLFFQKGKKCTKTKKTHIPVKFTYAGCSSVKQYRPKYCGSCVDGRCCTPQQTRTIKVQFHCDDGETFTKNVMMIQSCRCSYNCPHGNEAYPNYQLFNDIHKFRD
uniref:CCN family member 1 n=1 Tax=Laticauda laticaudata TaxID=8630 RepID=A0A8C5RRK5_LATLA